MRHFKWHIFYIVAERGYEKRKKKYPQRHNHPENVNSFFVIRFHSLDSQCSSTHDFVAMSRPYKESLQFKISSETKAKIRIYCVRRQ